MGGWGCRGRGSDQHGMRAKRFGAVQRGCLPTTPGEYSALSRRYWFASNEVCSKLTLHVTAVPSYSIWIACCWLLRSPFRFGMHPTRPGSKRIKPISSPEQLLQHKGLSLTPACWIAALQLWKLCAPTLGLDLFDGYALRLLDCSPLYT